MVSPEVLKGPIHNSPRTIFIGNGREFFSPIDPYVPQAHKEEFIQTDKDETDPMIFEHGDNKIIFVPQSIDADYIQDVINLFGFKNIAIIRTPETGNGLSKDILSNKETYNMLRNAIVKGGPMVNVVPWGQTPQFEELHKKLRQEGLIFQAPETPLERASWHPDYANTKLGTREILQRAQLAHPELGIRLPEGFPCPDIDTALKIAQYFIATKRGVVFKANLGAAGVGVFAFSPKDYDLSTPTGWSKMESKVRENTLLQNGPVIIEEYITPDFSQRGIFPSVDSLIDTNGTPVVQAVSTMGIHRNGEEFDFYGSTMGHGLFTKDQDEFMRKVNLAVGKEHAELGYRGWYDTDFILAKDGNLYLTETNVRRTGTTYMVDLARRLFGNGWENKMAMIANDKYIRPHLQGVTHPQLKEKLSGLLYPIEGKSRGIILTQSMRTMLGRGKFAYAAIGTTQEDAEVIEKELEQRLG